MLRLGLIRWLLLYLLAAAGSVRLLAGRRVWDFKTNREVVSWQLRFITYSTTLDGDGFNRDRKPIPCAISPDGEYVVEGGDGKYVIVYDRTRSRREEISRFCAKAADLSLCASLLPALRFRKSGRNRATVSLRGLRVAQVFASLRGNFLGSRHALIIHPINHFHTFLFVLQAHKGRYVALNLERR